VIGDPAFQLVVRASLALLFAVSLRHKLADLDAFRRVLWAYELLPERSVARAGTAVAAGELGLVIALLAAPAAWAAFLALVVLAIYTTAIAVNLARGRRDIDCGCGGPESYQRLGPVLLLRNGLLALVAATLLATPVARPLGVVDLVTVTLAVASLALLWSAAEALLVAERSLQVLRGRTA
jgi:hypothetical protein